MGFLPSTLPRVDGWKVAAYFKAAREVAGDFYDAFLLPDGNLACVVGDVCDKGVSATLFMALFRSLIRATSTTDVFPNRGDQAALTHAEPLQHVISFTNHYTARTHENANIFTAVFIDIFDLQNGTLSYMNCGNEPPRLLVESEEITKLRRTGPVVGVIADAQFSVEEVLIQKNDILLAFPDGFPDSKNAKDEFFRSERLFTALVNHNSPPSMLLDNIESQLQ